MKMITPNIRRTALVGVGALALTSISQAAILPLSFELSDSRIYVGETFEVNVSTSFEAALEIASFAFEIDPLNLLPGGGILSFEGWTIAAPLLEPLFPVTGLVAGEGDLFNPTFGGGNVPLATLTFRALGAGMETVSVEGLVNDFNGISLYDFDGDALADYDISDSFEVSVHVPDTGATLSLLSLSVGLLFYLRRARGRTLMKA